MRASGVLMHISSLPSPYGIGTFGRAAYEFVDFLSDAGQKFWQILPFGPTGAGDCPYQSFSIFAGNPYFIDLEFLGGQGLLPTEVYCALDWGDNPCRADYAKLCQNRFAALRSAFENADIREREEIEQFALTNKDWLADYAFFMALKERFQGVCWSGWEKPVRTRRESALEHWRRRLQPEIDFWIFVQYLFYKQWFALKAYANRKGIQIIGDLPIYTAYDSADVWAHPELFELDEKTFAPTHVAGVPPDYFSPDGQLWNNPLYRWDHHQDTGYGWWIRRMRAAMANFDMVRIDHFRGLASYYAVPRSAKTARDGQWRPGPGMALFEAMRRQLGDLPVIAEDLGLKTPDVQALLEQSGFPGMRVLQFAFGSDGNNPHLPHNYIRNCVAYTGTHDNNTLLGWWRDAGEPVRSHAMRYLGLTRTEGFQQGLLRAVWSSVAQLAVAPIQDFLMLGKQSRMNIPSTAHGNWCFRITNEDLAGELAAQIRGMSELYGRI